MRAAIMIDRQNCCDFWTFNNMWQIFDAILSGIANLVQLFSQNTLQQFFFISCFGGKQISFYGFCVEAKQCNREFLNRYREKLFLLFCDWSVSFQTELSLAQFVLFACSDGPVGEIGTDPKVRQARVFNKIQASHWSKQLKQRLWLARDRGQRILDSCCFAADCCQMCRGFLFN